MSGLDFQQLIELCRVTHERLRHQAARSVDIALVARNWLFGFYIVEFEQNGADRAEYGARFMDTLSRRLAGHGIKGVSPTRLKLYRSFYQQYRLICPTLPVESNNPRDKGKMEIRPTLSVESLTVCCATPEAMQQLAARLAACFQLGWSHYVVLLTLADPEERRFYEIEASANSWSVRELERQVGSSLYERLALSRDKEEIRRLAEQGLVVEKAADLIKNPYVLEFLGLETRPSYSEEELESAIIDKLEHFLLELGKGFLFEARQKRFTLDNDHFYVDLVFYNRLLRCYVLIDLKRDKLTHQDLGQMQMYVNYFDRHVKTEDETPTIGIVLCHRKNDALVELTLPQGTNIYASRYQLYLPSKEELRQRLLEWAEEVEESDGLEDGADRI